MSNPFNLILSTTTDRRSSLSALPTKGKGFGIGITDCDENSTKNVNDNGIRKTTSDENLNKFNQMVAANNSLSSHSRAAAGRRSKRESVPGLVNATASKTALKSSKSSTSSNTIAAASSKKHNDNKAVVQAAVASSTKKKIKQIDEVHILISRLKTLVGEVDEKGILDSYRKKNAASLNEGAANDEGAVELSPKKSDVKSSSSGASTIITFRSPEKNATESNVEYDITYSLVIDESIDDVNNNALKNSSIRVSEAIPRRRLPTRYSLGSKRFSLDVPGRSSLGGPLGRVGSKYRTISGDSDISESNSVCVSVRNNFTHFYTAGATRGVLNGAVLPERHNVLQPAALLDSYACDIDNSLSVENVQDYCFPEGVVARLVLKSTAAKYVGSSNDRFHLMQFSDATGKATYGCCLTITEAITIANVTVFDNLLEKEEFNSATSKICRAVFEYVGKRRSERKRNNYNTSIMQCKSPFINALQAPKTPGGSVMSRLKQTLDMSIAKSHSKFLSFASEMITTPSVTDAAMKPQKVQNVEDPVVQQYLRLIQSGNDGYGDSDMSEEEGEDEAVGTAGCSLQDGAAMPEAISLPSLVSTEGENASTCETKGKRRRLRMDECLVLTERAFCLVSERPLPSFLFKVLQAVANKERLHSEDGCLEGTSEGSNAAARKRSESVTTMMSNKDQSGSGVDGLMCDVIYDSRKVRRQNFLDYMNKFKSEKMQAASFPSYTPSFRVENRATTLEESSVAAVFCMLPIDAIMKILTLLLTEKSLVVYGAHAGVVSAVSTGLLSLLKPFTWEGIFVPLMPQTAREVLQAPVPFVIGTLRAPSLASLSQSVAVLYLDDYLDDCTSSASSSVKRYMYNPTDADPEYYYDPSKNIDYRGFTSRLNKLAQQLKLSSSTQSALSKRSAGLQLTTFLSGMQSAEKAIVKDILGVTYAHNKKLCGDLFSPSGWRNYGAVNSSTGEFEFYPQWFMDPLQMQLKFQEKVIHTQMFVSFMDRKRIDYTKLRARSRLFLSEWIFYRRWRRNPTLSKL